METQMDINGHDTKIKIKEMIEQRSR